MDIAVNKTSSHVNHNGHRAHMDPPMRDISPEEQEYLKKHAGHEGTHLLMVLILMIALIGMQFVLLEWRNRRPRSYSYVSLIGMALVPLLISIYAGFTRFIICWSIFALANSWGTYNLVFYAEDVIIYNRSYIDMAIFFSVIFRASRKPLSSRTPKLVYRWFAVLYQLCYATGICMCTVFVFVQF
jgi:RING finger protein 121